MVLVHKFPNGLELHWPPFTDEELAEQERLMNYPPIQMTSLRHVAERKAAIAARTAGDPPDRELEAERRHPQTDSWQHRRLALLLGLRIGEIHALCCDQVNIETQSLDLRSTKPLPEPTVCQRLSKFF